MSGGHYNCAFPPRRPQFSRRWILPTSPPAAKRIVSPLLPTHRQPLLTMPLFPITSPHQGGGGARLWLTAHPTGMCVPSEPCEPRDLSSHPMRVLVLSVRSKLKALSPACDLTFILVPGVATGTTTLRIHGPRVAGRVLAQTITAIVVTQRMSARRPKLILQPSAPEQVSACATTTTAPGLVRGRWKG
jgi:hypothetical protein